MSAFVISTETMQRVIAAITDNGKTHDGMFAGKYLVRTSGDLDRLGNELFALNGQAVQARYPGEPVALPDFSYRPLGAIPLEHRFMAIQCLLYQCDEGKVPQNALYKALEKAGDWIANQIAYRAARAQKTPWDWPEVSDTVAKEG
jgi:hypothetical protein